MYFKWYSAWVLMWNSYQNIFNIVKSSSFFFLMKRPLGCFVRLQATHLLPAATFRHFSVRFQTSNDKRRTIRPAPSFVVGAQSDRKNRGREWSWPAVVGFGRKGTMCSREDEKPWRQSFRKGPRGGQGSTEEAHPGCGWSCNILSSCQLLQQLTAILQCTGGATSAGLHSRA